MFRLLLCVFSNPYTLVHGLLQGAESVCMAVSMSTHALAISRFGLTSPDWVLPTSYTHLILEAVGRWRLGVSRALTTCAGANLP